MWSFTGLFSMVGYLLSTEPQPQSDILKCHSMFCLRCSQHNLLLRSVSAQDTPKKKVSVNILFYLSSSLTRSLSGSHCLTQSMINTKPRYTLHTSVLHWHSSVISQLGWKWARIVWLHYRKVGGFSRLWMLSQIWRAIETFINSTSAVGKCNLLLQSWI